MHLQPPILFSLLQDFQHKIMYKIITETNEIIKLDARTIIFHDTTLETDPMYLDYIQWTKDGNIAEQITQDELFLQLSNDL